MDSRKKILEIASNVLKLPKEKIDFNAEMKTIETWDSFAHLTLLSTIEEATGVIIPLEEYSKINTLQKLFEKIKEG